MMKLFEKGYHFITIDLTKRSIARKGSSIARKGIRNLVANVMAKLWFFNNLNVDTQTFS